MMWIDENWCIGCTLCIKACPVDAIVGVNKHMHTILEPLCTGCELCLPACPVDCIHTEPTHTTTGWAAWSPAQADAARQRHIFRRQRLARQQDEHAVKRYAKAAEKLSDLAHHSQHTDPAVLNKKRAMLDMILAKAKTRIQVSPQSQ
jgi:electron transport complex protein RnfB